jgi:hypothetical protein
LLRLWKRAAMSDIEESLKRITSHNGVMGVAVLDDAGKLARCVACRPLVRAARAASSSGPEARAFLRARTAPQHGDAPRGVLVGGAAPPLPSCCRSASMRSGTRLRMGSRGPGAPPQRGGKSGAWRENGLLAESARLRRVTLLPAREQRPAAMPAMHAGGRALGGSAQALTSAVCARLAGVMQI